MIAEILSPTKKETGFFIKKISEDKIRIVSAESEATEFKDSDEAKSLIETAAPKLVYKMKEYNQQ